MNFGPLEKRLQAFEDAVRHVYASTMDISALEYRMQRGLEKKDEQMSILVQRVSGSWAGPYYLPGVAGVGYSRCLYKTSQDADPTAGMLRLVVGLGTKAVDRTEDDYPRLVNLDRPTATTLTSVADRHRFSPALCGRHRPRAARLSGASAWRSCTSSCPTGSTT